MVNAGNTKVVKKKPSVLVSTFELLLNTLDLVPTETMAEMKTQIAGMRGMKEHLKKLGYDVRYIADTWVVKLYPTALIEAYSDKHIRGCECVNCSMRTTAIEVDRKQLEALDKLAEIKDKLVLKEEMVFMSNETKVKWRVEQVTSHKRKLSNERFICVLVSNGRGGQLFVKKDHLLKYHTLVSVPNDYRFKIQETPLKRYGDFYSKGPDEKLELAYNGRGSYTKPVNVFKSGKVVIEDSETDYAHKVMKIEDVDKGAYVKMKLDSKKVWQKTGWCNFNRAYELINEFRYVKRGTLVITDFEY